MKFSHILFPTDGSENSVRALNYVKEMAEKFQAKVTVINTFELPVLLSSEMYTDIYGQVLKSLAEQSMILLENVKKEMQGLSVEIISLEGSAGLLITSIAAEKNCDLIIMGSHEVRTLKNFLISSVSNYVIHHAQCPLLVIR